MIEMCNITGDSYGKVGIVRIVFADLTATITTGLLRPQVDRVEKLDYILHSAMVRQTYVFVRLEGKRFSLRAPMEVTSDNIKICMVSLRI